MKKIAENDELEVIEFKSNKKDILKIYLIKNAKLKHKKTGKIYFQSDYIKIVDRKNNFRIVDKEQGLDITRIFKDFELIQEPDTEIITMYDGR